MTRNQWRDLIRPANGTPESSTRNGRKRSSDSGGGLGSCPSDMAPHHDSCHPRIRTTGVKSRSGSSCSRHLGSSFAVSRQSVSQEGRIRIHYRRLSVISSHCVPWFHRFLKTEQERREIFQSVSGALDLDLFEAAQDAEWVLALERKIAVRQITDRTGGWTKRVWQARQYGYSWKEVSTWLGSRSTKRR